MGKEASGAVLYPFLCEAEISAAFVPQHIKRAIAEKTVKIFRIRPFMARKTFTFLMTEIGKFLSFPEFFLHKTSCCKNSILSYLCSFPKKKKAASHAATLLGGAMLLHS